RSSDLSMVSPACVVSVAPMDLVGSVLGPVVSTVGNSPSSGGCVVASARGSWVLSTIALCIVPLLQPLASTRSRTSPAAALCSVGGHARGRGRGILGKAPGEEPDSGPIPLIY